MNNKRQLLGKLGEDVATEFLIAQGFNIIARNWRSHRVELDIVARDGQTIVFCEVKTRRSNNCGVPAEAITQTKRDNLRTAALHWLSANSGFKAHIRFDVIGITIDSSRCPTISHIKGIDV